MTKLNPRTWQPLHCKLKSTTMDYEQTHGTQPPCMCRQKKMWGGTRTETRGHWIWLPSSTFPHQNRPIYKWLL